jgi:hypothetical protein
MKTLKLYTNSDAKKHRWTFFRAGGFDQVLLNTGADLMALDQLDQKLWIALSCPTHGLEFDSHTLALIDTDGDGRIRVPDIIEAVKWSLSLLKNPDDLTKGASEISLSAINDESPMGKDLLHSAKEILTNLGKPDSAVITADDMADIETIFSQARFNGDGVLPADAADDPQIEQVIHDIIDCLGGESDRSGKAGVSQEAVDRFFAECETYITWCKESDIEKNILPLGENTFSAATAYQAVKDKIDDYFARCRLVAFDERAANVLNQQEADYTSFADKVLSLDATEAKGFPLARIVGGNPLTLHEGLNPAWLAPVTVFKNAAVQPLLGDKDHLTEDEWGFICGEFTAYNEWQSRKTGLSVEKLGRERLMEIMAGNAREAIKDLIDRDLALKIAFDNIASVDKLIRYHRYLFTLLNNFICFSDFYTRRNKAIFQAGTLYLDGRSCELCVCVSEVEKHAAMATLSRTFIAYCDCTRKGGKEKMFIAAVFTDGDSDFLMVGRNGVFYDHEGQDWDATIVKVIDHPISIRQAFWSPYKKIGKMIREQIVKRAAAREKAATESSAVGVADIGHKLESGKPVVTVAAATIPPPPQTPPPPPPFDVGKFAGIFAAIGLAFGAIGTAIASAMTGFLNLQWWQMPLVLVGLILIVSGPSMILAWLKLRQRSLGPILDANGWAVNARARINVAFGASLTKIAVLPDGAIRSLKDPYADKKSPWPKIIIALIVLLLCFYILNRTGKIYDWTSGIIGKKLPTINAVQNPAASTYKAPVK